MARLDTSKRPAQFEPGAMLVGPESIGCFNTGLAPAIARSKRLDAAGRPAYVVGPEGCLGDACRAAMRGEVRGKTYFKPTNRGRTVKFFSTPAAAFRAYEAHCLAVLKANTQHAAAIRRERKAAQDAVAHGDIQGALEHTLKAEDLR